MPWVTGPIVMRPVRPRELSIPHIALIKLDLTASHNPSTRSGCRLAGWPSHLPSSPMRRQIRHGGHGTSPSSMSRNGKWPGCRSSSPRFTMPPPEVSCWMAGGSMTWQAARSAPPSTLRRPDRRTAILAGRLLARRAPRRDGRGPAAVGSHLALPLPWRDHRLGLRGRAVLAGGPIVGLWFRARESPGTSPGI